MADASAKVSKVSNGAQEGVFAAGTNDHTMPLPLYAWEEAPELPLAQLDAAAPDLTRLQVQLLANRGIHDPAAAHAFLAASWEHEAPPLLGLEGAVARLLLAAERQERVAVFGDYDVDGLTSCAVMILALRAAGISAAPHLPTRADDGRGPSLAAIRALAEQGHTLLVTTDSGTTNVAEVRLAGSLGIDTIISDHHVPQGELAPALALVNPHQPGCPSPERHLVGVGVALRLAEALLTATAPERARATLEALLDLAAIGTIADVASMSRENWRLVHAGLEHLNTRPRAGLRALAARAGLVLGAITERDISFALAPRLNAAGRMGDPLIALRLLLTEDAGEAERLAEQLQRLNEERQRVTDGLMTQARAQAAEQVRQGAALLVAMGDGWSLGVIGLVASRLAEEFARPAMVVSLNEPDCRGSLRAPVGFHLARALGQRAELLRHFGGHAQAAGFTVPRADLDTLLDHLRAAIAAQARDMGQMGGRSREPDALIEPDATSPLPVGERSEEGAAPLPIDCRLPLRRVTRESYDALRRLAPFGVGFAEPVFVAPRVRVARCWRSGPDGRTLRLALRGTRGDERSEQRGALWARQGAMLPAVRAFGSEPVDVAYRLDLDTRPGVEPFCLMRVVDIRPSAPLDPPRPPDATDPPGDA